MAAGNTTIFCGACKPTTLITSSMQDDMCFWKAWLQPACRNGINGCCGPLCRLIGLPVEASSRVADSVEEAELPRLPMMSPRTDCGR